MAQGGWGLTWSCRRRTARTSVRLMHVSVCFLRGTEKSDLGEVRDLGNVAGVCGGEDRVSERWRRTRGGRTDDCKVLDLLRDAEECLVVGHAGRVLRFASHRPVSATLTYPLLVEWARPWLSNLPPTSPQASFFCLCPVPCARESATYRPAAAERTVNVPSRARIGLR